MITTPTNNYLNRIHAQEEIKIDPAIILPSELMSIIFSHLDIKGVATCCLVSKNWYRLAGSDPTWELLIHNKLLHRPNLRKNLANCFVELYQEKLNSTAFPQKNLHNVLCRFVQELPFNQWGRFTICPTSEKNTQFLTVDLWIGDSDQRTPEEEAPSHEHTLAWITSDKYSDLHSTFQGGTGTELIIPNTVNKSYHFWANYKIVHPKDLNPKSIFPRFLNKLRISPSNTLTDLIENIATQSLIHRARLNQDLIFEDNSDLLKIHSCPTCLPIEEGKNAELQNWENWFSQNGTLSDAQEILFWQRTSQIPLEEYFHYLAQNEAFPEALRPFLIKMLSQTPLPQGAEEQWKALKNDFFSSNQPLLHLEKRQKQT